MAHVGKKVRQVILAQVEGLLKQHEKAIDEGYHMEEGSFTINLPVQLSESKSGGINVNTKINFVKERIKDSATTEVDEQQPSLFDQEQKPEPPKPPEPEIPQGGNRVCPVRTTPPSWTHGRFPEWSTRFFPALVFQDPEKQQAATGIPPEEPEKESTDTRNNATGDCTKCPWHKGMANKKKGVRIPEGYGKCTRPEGHCNPARVNTGIGSSTDEEAA